MSEVELKLLPFDEAIEFFRSKGYKLSPHSWRDVWAAEHVHAFTVARVTAMDVLEDIRKAVDQAIEKGVSLQRFKQELRQTLARKGWMAPIGEDGLPAPIKPWRLDVIYRTNIQAAYQAGRYKQMLDVASRRPYWMYDAVEDSRTRPTHAAMDGKVWRFDHPVWDRWYPPNGFNCRCTVRTLSERQMRSRGLKEETRGAPFSPDEGFDYNAGLVKWRPDLSKYAPEARRILAQAGVTHPTDVPALAERLTRMRDGMRDTGMRVSERPLRILQDRSTPYNAWARYETGEIGLRAEIYRTVRGALRSGRVMSDDEINAFKTVVHEFGHHLGHPIDTVRYRRDQSYMALAQTINDLWARHHTGHVLGALGLRYSAQRAARLLREHPSGYQEWVERMRGVLHAAGMDDAEQKTLVARLNLSVSPEEYSREIWNELTARKPGLVPRGDFGDILRKEDRYRWLLEELRG
jgi:SPP1 gp7 family putative phage head morphogenesis protein